MPVAMAIDAEARKRLAAAQEALVAALMKGNPPPPGFDRERLQVAAKALAEKRRKAVAATWPELTQALGGSFGATFAAFAELTPLPSEGGPLADGHRFAGWLQKSRKLPAAARLELLRVDLRYRKTKEGLEPRRGPALRVALLPDPRRLMVGLRLPWIGERWFCLLLQRQR